MNKIATILLLISVLACVHPEPKTLEWYRDELEKCQKQLEHCKERWKGCLSDGEALRRNCE